ncbi:MAG: polysaccharide deacetylase family protein [Clostridia bacterium]|nr:polysaccharide deacetylase family protein [Clostridia bacterium]
MKKNILTIISLTVILSVLLTSLCYAEGGEGWYIIKQGNNTPAFPKSERFLSEHACYAMDKRSAETGDKVLYLTFDAGYENGNVERILDTLKREEVPGAFFILSNLVKKNPELVKRMFEDGHTVCNHTKNHRSPTKLTDEEIEANLSELERLCYDATGYEMTKFFRYPEGYYNERTALTLEKLGYKTFFWSLAYSDWDNGRQPSVESAIKILTENIHPGAIVLLHPTSQTNRDALPMLISAWRAMGYRFGRLEDIVG